LRLKRPEWAFCDGDGDALSRIVSVAQLAGASVTTGGCGFESCRWRSNLNDRLQLGSAIGPGNGKDWAIPANQPSHQDREMGFQIVSKEWQGWW
jgi:hypothetical protein